MPKTRPDCAVVAHRGDSARFRENTMPAFRSAIDLGVDRVELDVRLSADGEVIVLHDRTLLRLWGLPARPESLRYEQIAQLGLGDVRIPRLRDVLDLLEGTGVGVMIDTDASDPASATDDRTVTLALAVIAERPRDIDIHWSGPVPAMRLVRARDPGAIVSYNFDSATAVGGEGISDGISDDIIAELRPAYLNVEGTLVSRDLVTAAHERGLTVSVWTIDTGAAMRYLIDLGVDSITTNRPAHLLRVRATPPPQTPPSLGRELLVASGLAQWAAAYIRGTDVTGVMGKSHGADLVTAVDTAVEQQVRRVIGEQFPDHAVVGEEEGGASSVGRPCWYLDPVDGTANLASGMPWSSFSLGMAVDREPLLGVVADPWRGEILTAAAGCGCWLDGLRLSCARTGTLQGGLVLMEWLFHTPWTGMPELIDALAQRYVTTRIMGSGTLALAGVGAGRALAAAIGEFNPIDHLAGLVIALESRAVVIDRSGVHRRWPAPGPFLVAAADVADQLAELFRAATSP